MDLLTKIQTGKIKLVDGPSSSSSSSAISSHSHKPLINISQLLFEDEGEKIHHESTNDGDSNDNDGESSSDNDVESNSDNDGESNDTDGKSSSDELWSDYTEEYSDDDQYYHAYSDDEIYFSDSDQSITTHQSINQSINQIIPSYNSCFDHTYHLLCHLAPKTYIPPTLGTTDDRYHHLLSWAKSVLTESQIKNIQQQETIEGKCLILLSSCT